MPNPKFLPRGIGHHEGHGGAYSVAHVSGNLLAIPVPDERELADFTARVLRDQALIGRENSRDGPDHVDCRCSVALIISVCNRTGALVHDFHTTAGCRSVPLS